MPNRTRGYGASPPGSIPSTPPPGWDLLTELRLATSELDERATKHGEEIDALRGRLDAFDKLKETARRYLLWALTSAASLAAHWQVEPAATKLGELLKMLAAALAAK